MNRRYIVFFTVFCSALFVGGLYVNLRLAYGFGWSLFYALPFSFVAFGFIRMVTSRSKGQKAPTVFELFIQRTNYILMGWISFLFVVTIVRDIVGVITLYINERAADWLLGENGAIAVLILSVVSLLWGMYPALNGPSVKQVEVPIKNLKPELSGMKIAQISDLHIGPFIGASYTQKVVDRVREQAPTIVALTGDIFDADYEYFHRQGLPLADLAKFSKTFFVSGNHEYYWESAKWFSFVRSLGIDFLKNESRVFDLRGAKVSVAGIVDFAARMIGEEPSLADAAKGEPADLKLLLVHQPQVADKAAEHGFDLQLSGHTHGGQFFPWTLVVRKVHKYHQGLFRVAGKMWVYVSPGTGFWGPPVRLGTKPEVSLLTLVRAP